MSIKRALVSVSDKQGIVDFCRELSALGVEIISTGGTSTLLAKEGVPVIGISEVTGFPKLWTVVSKRCIPLYIAAFLRFVITRSTLGR